MDDRQEYGLIGHPLGHSFSRRFFTEKFLHEAIDAEYLNFDIPSADELPGIIANHPRLRGLNVTIPYKQAVIPLLDTLSDEAREIGAVNVIRIERKEDGSPILRGFNSDIIGFTESIKPLLSRKHRNALVLGTGGASKAVGLGLTKLGLDWQYVSRSRREGMLTYDDLTPRLMRDFQVIVNCSPVGMFPHIGEAPLLPYEALSGQHILFDLVYNPVETLFMRLGAQHGATVKNGLEMLHLQALSSWDIWNQKY
ncbi:MAG: shikimate dehydrogenase [Bacteroidaceae bacterium]|nr:shikimate dehydrogenase [Bacteroidaceae bacterium]